MKIETKRSKCRVTCTSLIGVGGLPPYSWGNYCTIEEGRLLNMWAENIRPAMNLVSDNLLEITVFDDKWAIVTDKRVPQAYLHNKCCFTGGEIPPKEVAREIYNRLGDPNNEYEQFEDPVAYWKKKGGEYMKTGVIHFPNGFKGTSTTVTEK